MPETQTCSPEGTTQVTLESLLEKNKKLTAEQLASLKDQIGVNPIDVTCTNLEVLKTQIGEMGNADDVKKAINEARKPKYPEKVSSGVDYKERLAREGYSAINLDTVMEGASSNRLLKMRDDFEKEIDSLLGKYTFLDKTSKDIIKLALANKFIDSKMGIQAQNMTNEFGNVLNLKGFDGLKLFGKNVEKSQEKNSPENFEEQFKQIVAPYISGFDEISKKLDSFENLTDTQKQNIVNNVAYFRNPKAIENGFDNKVIEQILLENKDKILPNEITPGNLDELANYLSKSRQKVKEVNGKMEGGDQLLEKALGFASIDGFVGDTAKGILGFLLKIPFIGKLLAGYLGLDPENPMGDFESKLSDKKFLNTLITLGGKADKSGNVSGGEGVFSGIDLSQIQSSGLKDELAKLNGIKGDKYKGDDKNPAFWKDVFTTGIEVDGINLTLVLTDKVKEDKKITTKEFRDIVNNAFYTHKKAKEVNELEAKKEERTRKEQEHKEEMTKTLSTLQTSQEKVVMYDSIIRGEYKNITNWSTISGLEIGKLTPPGNDSSAVLNELLKDFSEKDRPLLAETLILIREYCKEKNIKSPEKIKDIVGGGFFDKTLEKVGISENKLSDFNEYVKTKREPFAKEVEEKDKLLQAQREKEEKQKKAKELESTLNAITTPTKLSSGRVKDISFDSESQTLTIAGEKYKISINHSKFGNFSLNDIIVDDRIVTLNIKNSPTNKEIPKLKVTNGIYDLITKGKFEQEEDGSKLVIEKI